MAMSAAMMRPSADWLILMARAQSTSASLLARLGQNKNHVKDYFHIRQSAIGSGE
jgi:hypothetical protein